MAHAVEYSVVKFDSVARFLVEHARRNGRVLPSEHILGNLLSVVFYGSLSREEGMPIRFDVFVIDPDHADLDPPARPVERRWRYVPLTNRIPLSVSALAKLANAADPWATALAVFHHFGEWFIWALIDQQVHFNRWRYLDAQSGPDNPAGYRISVEDVGHVVIYWDYSVLVRSVRDQLLFSQDDVFWEGPVASRLMELVEPLLVEVEATAAAEMLSRHQGWRASARSAFIKALQRILLHMNRYHHGGALIIGASTTDDLKPKYGIQYDRLRSALIKAQTASVVARDIFDQAFVSSVVPASQFQHYRETNSYSGDVHDEVDGCVHFIAGLSRVDGLIWMDDRFAVSGFGVEITIQADPPSVDEAEDAEGIMRNSHDARTFGMRHRSMMRYCYAHPETVGFVVSQDGPVRAMLRSEDTLLLWKDIVIREE